MGFLGKLFGKDPADLVAKSERLLGRGQGVAALQAAEDALATGFEAVRKQAEELVERSHGAILASALEEASRSKEAELWEEAAGWVDTALLHCFDDEEKKRLGALHQAYLNRAGVESSEEALGVPPTPAEAEHFSDEEDEEFYDYQYEPLLALLRAEVATRYRGRSTEFRQAYLALAEGRADAAIGAFEEALRETPEDPVLHLERGRCHLVMENFSSARDDFEVAWKEFGDEPLDQAEMLLVPALWAESMLGLEQWEAVVERLKGLADFGPEDSQLPLLFAQALVRTERGEEILEFLRDAASTYNEEPRFAFLLAQNLRVQGEFGEATACLEQSLAPSCASGSCAGSPDIFPPSLHLLIDLYLEAGGPKERLRSLLELVPYAKRGALMVEDVELLARYCELETDSERSAWGRASLETWAAQLPGGVAQGVAP